MSPNLHATRIMLADDHAVVFWPCGCRSKAQAPPWWARPSLAKTASRMYGDGSRCAGDGHLHARHRRPGALSASYSYALKARVLMLSAHSDDIMPTRALRMGARGYLCKRAAPDEFFARSRCGGKRPALYRPGTGRGAGPGAVVEIVQPRGDAVREGAGSLSATGLGALRAAGGRRLSPEPQHRGHPPTIKQKLNVQNAAELALVALRNGMIDV